MTSLHDTFNSVEAAATPPPENASMTFTGELPSPNLSGKTKSKDPEGQNDPVAGSKEYQDPLFESGPPRSASPSTSRSTASTGATEDDV